MDGVLAAQAAGEADRAAQRRRWMTRHGAFRGLARRRALDGVVGARLALEPEHDASAWPDWELLRSEGPFAEGAVPGMLMTVHHAVAREVLTSDAFAMPNTGAAVAPDAPPGPLDPPSLLALDDAEHSRLRGLMARTFSARAVAGWSETTERIAAELLADLTGRTGRGGEIDLVADWAAVVPVRVIAAILGLPVDAAPGLPRWADSAAAALDTGIDWERFVAIESDLAAMQQWLRGQLARRRRHPGDDLVSHLVEHGDVDDDALVVLVTFLIAAGIETSTHLLSAGAATLTAQPGIVASLRAEPDLWPGAVEELLRLEPPVTRALRRATRDVDVCGHRVERGRIVVVHITAANRDPAVFAEPAAFDPARPNARAHLTFSLGPHHCLGAGLARVEGQAGLRAFAERLDAFEPAGPTPWRTTQLVRGRAALPVRLR